MTRRYNIFNEMHKALRGLLYDTALQLQRSDFSVEEEASHALVKVELVLSLFEHHARNEDRYILSVVKQYDPLLYSYFENQQAREDILHHSLKTLLAAYHLKESKSDREEAGDAILECFNNYISSQLTHMSLQETEVNAILWNNLTDQQLLRLSNTMIISMPPEIRFIKNNWMLRCTNNKEILLRISNIKDHAPEFVFQSLLELAEKVLPEDRWTKIRESLIEGVLVT